MSWHKLPKNNFVELSYLLSCKCAELSASNIGYPREADISSGPVASVNHSARRRKRMKGDRRLVFGVRVNGEQGGEMYIMEVSYMKDIAPGRAPE